jgi:hypothetical protein
LIFFAAFRSFGVIAGFFLASLFERCSLDMRVSPVKVASGAFYSTATPVTLAVNPTHHLTRMPVVATPA